MLTRYSEITKRIETAILEYVKDVLAILYIGSWAKKEMSYTIRNGQIDFLNDIDVLIITKKKMNNYDVKLVRDRVSKVINPHYVEYEKYVFTEGLHNLYVDIRNLSEASLKDVHPRIKYYDIFNQPCIIYVRDEDILNKLPTIKLEAIPNTDGLVHLFNRMALLVEWHPYVLQRDVTLLILVLKAYTAILDCLLLLAGKYVVSLKEKADIFQTVFSDEFGELHKALPDLADRAQKMVDIKINFYKYYFKLTNDDLFNIWVNARNDIVIVTLFVINRLYKTRFELSLDSVNILGVIGFLEKQNGFAVIPYINHRLRRYGFNLPSFLRPFAFIAIRYLYFKRLKESNRYRYRHQPFSRSIRSTREPTTILYMSALALLAGITYTEQEVTHDSRLVGLASEYLADLSFHNKVSQEIVSQFKESFRIWELFTFER